MAEPTEATGKTVLFLPGAAGDGSFWEGVGERLPETWEKRYLSWPGLGNQPRHHEVRGMGDLLTLATKALRRPSVVVAQSMGGIVAIQLALRHPERVTYLVLTATSGGLDVVALGGADWRPQFLEAYPDTARWILAETPDLRGCLSDLQVPTVLLWGAEDPISPVAVGRYLKDRIPRARLIVIPGGGHSMAADMPGVIAAHLVEEVSGFARGGG